MSFRNIIPFYFLILTGTQFPFPCVLSTEVVSLRKSYADSVSAEAYKWRNLSRLLTHLITVEIPECDVILIHDIFFDSVLIKWIETFEDPIYTITLDNKPFPDYTTWVPVTKNSGFLCSTIVVCCSTEETCRTPDSPTLYTMLKANGILLKERRSIIFINDEQTSTMRPPAYYEKENTNQYRLPVMEKAVKILEGLGTHIILIRKLVVTNTTEVIYQDRKDEEIYQLLTWTPNWVPGGSPILFNVWSSKTYMKFKNRILLKQKHIRPGGTARYCTSSKDLLPFIDIDENNNPTGLDAAVINIFAERFQLTPIFFEPADNDFGSKTKDNWTGAIGYAVRKEADFAIGQITFTSDRFNADLTFTPAFTVAVGVVICPPPSFLPHWKTLFHPLDKNTWISILTTFVLVVCLLEGLQRVNARIFKPKIKWGWYTTPKIKKKWFPWIQTVGPMFQRSISDYLLPRNISILVAFGFWLEFTFLISACYSTLLISTLAVRPREPPVDSVEQLISQQENWEVSGLLRQSLINTELRKEKILLNKAYQPPEGKFQAALDLIGFKYVNETGKCLVAEKLRAKYFIQQNFSIHIGGKIHPQMYISQDDFVLGPTGWAMRGDVDFLLKNYFDILFIEFRCFGFLDKASQMFSTPSYAFDQNQIVKPLRIESVQVIFYSFAIGIVVSVIIFVWELIIHKSKMLILKNIKKN